jgi:signal transduction histidine kinase
MTPRPKHPLNTRILRGFILQICLITGTAVAGVSISSFLIQELLINSALEREADYFWARKKIEEDTPAPNTNTLIGYLFKEEEAEIPSEFEHLGIGLHETATPAGKSVVHVSASDDSRLFLVFDANLVSEAANFFGLFPLVLILIVLYLSAWFAYRITSQAVSPVVRLARSVRNIELDKPDLQTMLDEFEYDAVDSEIGALANALQQLLVRVDDSIERERTFTREASHELRSPLTVIRMACDNLSKRENLDASSQVLLERVQRATKDMEELTEVLLLLARQYEGALLKEDVAVNDIVRDELNRCKVVYETKGLSLRLIELDSLVTFAAPKVVSIVFGNLLRNACVYTDQGEVIVTITSDSVAISDSGVGMTAKNMNEAFSSGYNPQNARGNGIGLSLVKRITDRFGWRISVDSQPHQGTNILVEMGDPAPKIPRSTS